MHLFFLSLLRAQPTNLVFLSSSSFSSDAHKQTHPHPHPHPHTNTSTQRYTNTLTHKQTHTDKPTERQIEARGSWSMLDQSSWVLINAWQKLMGPDRCLTGARGSWSLLDWSSSWSLLVERSKLMGLLLQRSSWVLIGAWLELVGLDRCLTGAHLDRCLWNDRSAWVFCLNEAWPRWVLPDRN